MDDNQLISSFVSSGITGVIVVVTYILYKVFKHSKCRSKCCGHETELQVDLENGLLRKSNSPPNRN